MRWLRLLFRIFGWLLTPFLAWAASFFGAVGGALIAMRMEDPVRGPRGDGALRRAHRLRGADRLAELPAAVARGPRGAGGDRGRDARHHRTCSPPSRPPPTWSASHESSLGARSGVAPAPAVGARPQRRRSAAAPADSAPADSLVAHRAGRRRDLVHPGPPGNGRRRRALRRPHHGDPTGRQPDPVPLLYTGRRPRW